MDVVAHRAADILIGVRRLHRVDAGHETGMLVDGVTVDGDVLHGDGQLVTAGLQPLADAAVV